MVRMLFVDDEENVLSALRRMLHSMAREWDMVFVNSGYEALDALETGFFDIVVSDLRMPGMDGVALLQEVRQRSPETVRIALTGYADRNTTLRAVSQVHQFFTKPFDPVQLKAVLDRAIGLGCLLTDERLRRFVAGIKVLPSVSTLHQDVIRELRLPEASAARAGEIIARDAGMSSKVLQLVNSALFGLPQVISDPVHATVLLGLDAISVLVLAVKMFDEFGEGSVGGLPVSAAWNHCVAVARLAKRIALAECAAEPVVECAFLGGLLHDIGRLVLATHDPERYGSVLRLSHGQPSSCISLEERILGGNHAEVGAYLMGLWGFSDTIIDAIRLHHTPSAAEGAVFGPLAAVHVADAFAHTMGSRELTFGDYVDHAFLERLNATERIPVWHQMAMESIGKDCS